VVSVAKVKEIPFPDACLEANGMSLRWDAKQKTWSGGSSPDTQGIKFIRPYPC